MMKDLQHTLDLVRAFNQSLGPILNDPHFVGLESLPLSENSDRLRFVLPDAGWADFTGHEVSRPFEMQMMRLALLTSCWVADIFNRKSRDRHAPMMTERYLEFKNRLLLSLNFIETAVWTKTDKAAEEAWMKDVEKFGTVEMKRKYGLLKKRRWF